MSQAVTSGGGRPAGLAHRSPEPNPIDRTAEEDLETVRPLVEEELEAAHGVEPGRRRPFLVRMGDVDTVVAPVRASIEERVEPEAELGRDQQVVPYRDPLKRARERMQPRGLRGGASLIIRAPDRERQGEQLLGARMNGINIE